MPAPKQIRQPPEFPLAWSRSSMTSLVSAHAVLNSQASVGAGGRVQAQAQSCYASADLHNHASICAGGGLQAQACYASADFHNCASIGAGGRVQGRSCSACADSHGCASVGAGSRVQGQSCSVSLDFQSCASVDAGGRVQGRSCSACWTASAQPTPDPSQQPHIPHLLPSISTSLLACPG